MQDIKEIEEAAVKGRQMIRSKSLQQSEQQFGNENSESNDDGSELSRHLSEEIDQTYIVGKNQNESIVKIVVEGGSSDPKQNERGSGSQQDDEQASQMSFYKHAALKICGLGSNSSSSAYKVDCQQDLMRDCYAYQKMVEDKQNKIQNDLQEVLEIM